MPVPAGGLHACLVRATQAPARIGAVDAAAARAAPGVVAVLFAADLPAGGDNTMGPIAHDEASLPCPHLPFAPSIRTLPSTPLFRRSASRRSACTTGGR